MNWNRLTTHLAILTIVLCITPTVRAQSDDSSSERTEQSGKRLITPKAEHAIERGLAWLAARQREDGSYGSGTTYRRNVAVGSLCGMAHLAGGHTPSRGRYGENVSRTVDFIVSAAEPNGMITISRSASHGPMYGHGFATLFLAEVYGMSRSKEVRQKLEKAVQLIVSTQNNEGGWRYYPQAKDADVSVTVCQMMALRAARNSGISVPKETVDRCIEYVKRCQNVDGGFRYQLRGRPESLFPRSAAGLVALYSAGVYEGREIERGLGYLSRYVPQQNIFHYENHYFYGHYYAVQAMWHAGDDYWERWYPAIRDELISRQLPDGGWTDSSYTNEYGTAMACIILQIPNNYLPIFQR